MEKCCDEVVRYAVDGVDAERTVFRAQHRARDFLQGKGLSALARRVI